MPETVFSVVEVVGTSDQSISKAVSGGVEKASDTLRNLGWFEVTQMRGHVRDGKVDRYQVALKIGFRLEE